jgi:hypothetical protein
VVALFGQCLLFPKWKNCLSVQAASDSGRRLKYTRSGVSVSGWSGVDGVVEVDVTSDGRSGLTDRLVCVQVDLFVLDGLPGPFHEDVVTLAALAGLSGSLGQKRMAC